jgi:hypothetical protein
MWSAPSYLLSHGGPLSYLATGGNSDIHISRFSWQVLVGLVFLSFDTKVAGWH